MIIEVNNTFTVDSYPYGRLRTKAMFSLEFKNGKGYRSVFQTVDPKTGRINNPKKGTYNDFMFMLKDEQGIVKFHGLELYKLEDVEKVSNFMSENFGLYSSEQIKYAYGRFYQYIKITIMSMQNYCNSDGQVLNELFGVATQKAIKGFDDPSLNIFDEIKIDVEAIEATKEKNFQPFHIVSYGV